MNNFQKVHLKKMPFEARHFGNGDKKQDQIPLTSMGVFEVVSQNDHFFFFFHSFSFFSKLRYVPRFHMTGQITLLNHVIGYYDLL